MNTTHTYEQIETQACTMRRALLSTLTVLRERFASAARAQNILDLAAEAPMFADAMDAVERALKAVRIYETALSLDKPHYAARIDKLTTLVTEELARIEAQHVVIIP